VPFFSLTLINASRSLYTEWDFSRGVIRMSDSIERFWQTIPRYQRLQVVPVAMLLLGLTTADPTRRPTGYRGVLSVPTSPTAAKATRPDPLLEQQRRDIRASRGRVLYAPGHGPSSASAPTAAHKKPAPKAPCTMRVGEGRQVPGAPTT
jgi:hypothetical protein